MSANDNNSSANKPSTNTNEDILKSLRQLNSCITLTSVKDSNPEPDPPSSPSASSSEGEAEDDSNPLPPALRGISIQGHSKGTEALLSNLLGKKGKEDTCKKDKEQEENSHKSFLNEWSKRCLSISFTSKPTGEGEEEEDRAKEGLENGTPSSSASNSASNSRDSLSSGKRKSRSTSPPENTNNSSVSFHPLSDVAKSLSVSVVKGQSEGKSVSLSNNNNSRPPPKNSGLEIKTQPKAQDEEKEQSSSLSQRRVSEEDGKKDEEEEEQQPEGRSSDDERPLSERLVVKQQQTNQRSRPVSPKDSKFTCSFCSDSFLQHSELIEHISKCNKLGVSISFPSQSSSKKPFSSSSVAVARKKTSKSLANKQNLHCVRCRVQLSSQSSFQAHHLQHVSKSVRVTLKRYPAKSLPNFAIEGSEDSDSRGSSTGSGSAGGHSRSSEEKGLKLTFKISSVKKRGRGQKRKTKVQIVSPQEMSEGFEDRVEEGGQQQQVDKGTEGEQDSGGGGEKEDGRQNGEGTQEESSFRDPLADSGDQSVPQTSDENLPGSNSATFPGFGNEQLNFNADAASDRPPSTYQPQFESFHGDWFNEYDSGSRIAAAMTGASSEGSDSNDRTPFNTNNNNSNDSAYGTEDPRNRTSPYGSDGSEVNKEHPGSTSSDRDGLFSQAVLGGEPNHGTEEARQGSFEQLCLNDSFGQNQQEQELPQTTMDPNYPHNQQYHNQQTQGGSDLLSELAYLNNSGQQMDPTRVSPLDNTERPFSSQSSNSGTPTSSGQPTPPPTDTSFRALATSPLNSPTSPMNTGGPTPPMQPGISPPIPSSSSPLQQMGQMGTTTMHQQLGSQSQDSITAPRITIANNLMATTTNSGMGPMAGAYGQQWAPGASSQQNFPSTYMQSTPMPGAIGSGIRPQVHNNLPMGYRPSPPPRIRGRPPLMGHVGRPPMMRGPGRPPGSSNLPPLMAAPGGTRGGMMPSLQRLPQYGAGQRQPMMGGQKRGAGPSNQSPNKSLRREDINVPSRQKDNECQIIAVANRTGDGMPVIANVQGGSNRDDRNSRPPTTTSESTIHLSDSITLSVRSNSGTTRDSSRAEKSGDAGVVANLLASRGITVAPAAGDKDSGGGGREERRLPTASDLNLSSAISVHPPTSRDRDGFAVPHPPSAKTSSSNSSSSSSVNNQVDRPPRPPTVDLTQEVPSGGSQATRLQCHQCERTFPTQALLSDHAKIHQQQTQSRMPFKCHLCTAGFSTQKGQQHHYQQFHQLHLSAADLAIPVVDFRNPVNVQRMARLGIRSFLPLSNLQNRGAGGVVGIPILTLENLHNGQMNLQQWGITDVLTLGPPRTMNVPR